MSKYKYYFKKPKTEIVKDIFYALFAVGAICIAASSPYFVRNVIRGIKSIKKYEKKKISSVFYDLKKEGYIDIKMNGRQIYISLTEKGRKKAGWMQINDLKIKRSKKWDKKWRLVIFDIAQIKKNYREAFRGKLKQLGFYPLQKSVWIYPFDCRDEIELLKNFFGLREKELKLIIAEDIGLDKKLKKLFQLF